MGQKTMAAWNFAEENLTTAITFRCHKTTSETTKTSISATPSADTAPQSNASIWRFAGSMNSVDAIVSCTGFGHADTLLTTASLVSTVGDASFEGVSGSIGSDINVSRDSRIAAPAVETVESTEIDLIFSVLFAVAVVALVVAGSNVLVLF